MPKSTPRPTNRTANAIESRFSEPTIIRPDRGGDGKADKEIDEHREDDLRRMQRHPENEQHDEHGADAVDDGAVLDGRVFLIGDRNRSGQPDPRAIFAGEIEIAGRLPDRVGRILARLQRIVVEDRLELDEGAPIGIGQRLVADEFAPGERRRALVQHVLDRLGDQVERPLGAVELDLSALDAGKPGFQRAGQSADAGIAGHDLDQGGGDFELAGQLADLGHGQEQQPVLFKELPGAERLDRFEIRWYRPTVSRPAPWLAALVSSGVGASTTARMVRSRSNASPNWLSRLRQSRLGEISVLMSVLMEKCRAV